MFTKKRIALLILIVLLAAAVPVMVMFIGRENDGNEEGVQLITLWQIDGFEGGKGSRAQYLKNKALDLFDGKKVYFNVLSLSADAAAKNLEKGQIPDMISCAPTFCAHVGYINSIDYVYKNWCYGSYCLLTLKQNDDFSAVNSKNTVINAGKDNFASIAALFCGLDGAKTEEPTNAYLSLLGGKAEYMLGTQRDIYRLKTRGVSFSVKKIDAFNDLYQNISILAKDKQIYATCRQFTEYITVNNADVYKIGMLSANAEKYDDEMAELQSCGFEYELKSTCGQEFLDLIKSSSANKDLNKLKILLK